MAPNEVTPDQPASGGHLPPQAVPPVLPPKVFPPPASGRAQFGLPYPGLGISILMVMAVVVLQILFALPIEIVGLVFRSATKRGPEHWAQHPLIVGAINTVAIGLVILWGVVLNKAPIRKIVPLVPVRVVLFMPIILMTLGAGILLSEADNAFRWLLPMPKWLMQVFQDLVQGFTSFWGSLLTLAVVAPVTEELLCRGLIFRGLLSRYRTLNAVLLSALLFAILHLNPWQFISAAVLGVMFAWWFLETRSLLPCLVGHALTNALVVCLPHLPVQIPGFNTPPPAVEFQPWWLDLTGVVMTALGIWWFKRLVRKPGGTASAGR